MPVVSSSVNWMVPGGKECFPVSIDGYRILFPGDYVTNEGFENADIRSGSLRSAYPVFPIGQSDHNFITFQFDGEDIVPGNSGLADLDAFPIDLDIAEGDGLASFISGDGPGQQTSDDFFINGVAESQNAVMALEGELCTIDTLKGIFPVVARFLFFW